MTDTQPVYRLNFDPAESVRIARAVGFDVIGGISRIAG
jgi:hypothetical protein